MSRECWVSWRDENGKFHRTAPFPTLLQALNDARKEADRQGLQLRAADGHVTETQPLIEG